MTPNRSWLAPLRTSEWVVYAKRPCAGPGAVLACLSRYTHRVAISNRRLASLDADVVSFRWKDCRAKGRTRHKTMTLTAEEFMRGFLLHVLPCGFHRIRHYGLLANAGRRPNLARARELLGATPPDEPRTIPSAPEAAALSTTPPPASCAAAADRRCASSRPSLGVRRSARHRRTGQAHDRASIQCPQPHASTRSDEVARERLSSR